MKKNFVLFLLSYSVCALAQAEPAKISCQSILLKTGGKAEMAAETSLERKIGAQTKFEDKLYSYDIEFTKLGLFLQLKNKETKKETLIKANFSEEAPYFDIILPVHLPKKNPGLAGVTALELECK